MSKSLRNIPSTKQRSSSSNYISLHFNKADEEQLEISYGEVDEKSKEQEEVLKNKDSDGTKDNDEKVTSEDLEDPSSLKSKLGSKDSNRDSVVKDYWSRLSKRAGSLDSDLAISDKNSDQNEGWMFFKDIKGKLAKTLEERKQTRGSAKVVGSESLGSFSKEDYDRLLTEEDKTLDKSVQLSPAIEVLDGDKLDDEFENYVEGELQRAKCEILSPTDDKLPSTSDELIPQSSSANSIPDLTIQNSPGTNEIDSSKSENPKNPLLEATSIIRDLYLSAKTYWNSLLCRLLIALLALCLVPVPSWFSGFIAGAFLSGYIVYQLLKNQKPKEKLFIPEFNHTPNVEVTEAEEATIFKGWMNELPSDIAYNPDTYHVNCTRSIYVRLDGSYLRVSYPQSNIPKRAMYNEPRFERQFIHQQHYDITSANVELLPSGLVRKRLWSKKYPICLTVPNLSSGSKDSCDLQATPKTSSKKDSPIKRLTPRINENNEVVLILFSRTDRDKDLWYYRFKKAARIKLLKNYSPMSSPDLTSCEIHNLENRRTISAELDTLQIDSLETEDFVDLSMSKQQKFELYMSRLMAPLRSDPFLLASSLKEKKSGSPKSTSSSLNSMAWLNALIGRLFFDFITEDVWAQCVAEKIRKKLSKLKLPVFLTELNIKDINLGSALPKIHRASEPTVDHRGIWIDIDLSYNGSFQMTLETKLNLLRYRSSDTDDLSLADVSKGSESINQVLRSPVYNSEEEDSAESSSDEDFPAPVEVVEESSQAAGGSAGKKLLRLVDRFAQSTYFQSAAKNKYIKKAMEDISNTPLVLTVEVQWLAGTLALNLPPSPTDRLWYGFRTNPYLSIVARPKLGHHAVTLTHITEWIERKLVLEFQKLLVMPNMDDLIIPIMQPDLDLPKS